MTVEQAYRPDPTTELTLEWIVRQLHRISAAIGQGDAGNGRTMRTVLIDSSSVTTYNVSDRDEVILVDTTTAAVTVNLTNAADNRVIYIKNFDSAAGSHQVTVAPDTGDDINYTGANATINVSNSLQFIYNAAHANHFTI